MEQEVLLVEEVVDPASERKILRCLIVKFHVNHEVIVEGTEHAWDDVGVSSVEYCLPL